MIKIGNIELKYPVFLAPMAGITDYPYRIICKEYGANLVYTEFVSSNGIIRENQKTLDMIKFKNTERPIGVQIFGDNPEIVGKSAEYIYRNFKPDLIDINYGCPVPKITKKGAGSAALKDLCLMYDITQAVVESVPDIPITVKMRSGWDEKNIICDKVGPNLESIGIKAITLHARTTKQLYSGKANWNHIKNLKNNVGIPVIGNGDVTSPDDFKKMIKETNCDAVMIGRGALGKPWIFKEIINSINKKKNPDITLKEIIDISLKHIDLLNENKTSNVAINLSKKHLAYYLKGFPNISTHRKTIMSFQKINEITDYLKSINF